MKKRYMEPLMEAMEIESIGMLCDSLGNGFTDETTEPAKAPLLIDWDED
jgi:hypothetical protein